MQHHWHPERRVKGSHDISEDQRQMAFQNWVAYGRSQSSDVSAKEYLMCPLLWCRGHFEDLASTLQHVARCPCLADGWYWCPHCCRPEQFTDAERSYVDYRRCTPRRKGSKLKRAVEFFKHLGLKTCPKSRRPARRSKFSNGHYGYQSIQYNGQYETPELAGTSLGPAELPSDSGDEHKSWSNSVGEEGQTYEMEQPPPYSAMDLGVKDDEPMFGRQREAQLGIVSWEIDDSLRHVNARERSVDTEFKGFAENETLVSPISDVQESSYDVGIPDLTPKEMSKPVNPTCVPFERIPWLQSVHSDRRPALVFDDLAAASISLPDFPGFESRFARKQTSAQAQIEELRDLVRVINFEWIKRLDSAPDLRVPYSDHNIRSLFETGIEVLQRCYQNILPTTFKEVFALMHIACGVFYIRHGNEACYGWGELFQDFLRLQYAMSEERDIHLLIAITNQLWCPDCVILPQGPTVSPTQTFGPVITVKPQSAHFVNLFRNGMIIRECSEFLNGKFPCRVLCATSYLTSSLKGSSAQA